MDKPSPIKVFDLNGEKIKEIKESKDCTFFIDIYYDIINIVKFWIWTPSPEKILFYS